MKRQNKYRSLFAMLLLSAAFVLSGCYTQLAKPSSSSESLEGEYYVEEHGEYDEDSSEYEDSEYAEEEEKTVEQYYIYNYYGFYPDPWWYDPFVYDARFPWWSDPFFAASFAPTYVSIHVGYYDPFFYGYYRPWYRRHHAYSGFHFGTVWWPSYYSGYYGWGWYTPPVYVPVYVGDRGRHDGPPRAKRDFSQRGTRGRDDFGYRPTRISRNSPGDAQSAQNDRTSKSRSAIARRGKPEHSGKQAARSDRERPHPNLSDWRRKSKRPGTVATGPEGSDRKPKPAGIANADSKLKPRAASKPTRISRKPDFDSSKKISRSRSGKHSSKPRLTKSRTERKPAKAKRTYRRSRHSKSAKPKLSSRSSSSSRHSGKSYHSPRRSTRSYKAAPRRSFTAKPKMSRSRSSSGSRAARSAGSRSAHSSRRAKK